MTYIRPEILPMPEPTDLACCVAPWCSISIPDIACLEEGLWNCVQPE